MSYRGQSIASAVGVLLLGALHIFRPAPVTYLALAALAVEFVWRYGRHGWLFLSRGATFFFAAAILLGGAMLLARGFIPVWTWYGGLVLFGTGAVLFAIVAFVDAYA
jgi:hypothetical protein